MGSEALFRVSRSGSCGNLWISQRSDLCDGRSASGKPQIMYGGHMAAAMALMESPPSSSAFLWLTLYGKKRLHKRCSWFRSSRIKQYLPVIKLLRLEKFSRVITIAAQTAITGAMVVGLITGDTGKAAMQHPFSDCWRHAVVLL
jgi:hypothetical protein